MAMKIPGVDLEKGLDLYDDEFDLYLTVLRSYISNTPAALDRLRNVSAETLPDYAAAIHGVKGTSANIGAEETRKTALKLETAAKAGDLAAVLAENKAFLSHADALMDGLKKWLEEYDAGKHSV